MTWIRGPWWDGFWFLSAPALGAVMVFWPWPLALLLWVNFAHAVAPIGLAWTHDQFRGIMLARPHKFVGVPILLAAVGLATAAATSIFFPDFKPYRLALENLTWDKIDVPIVWWANLYAVWNLYHAGAQNFGIWCLYRRRGYRRGAQKYLVLAAVVVITVLLGHEITRLFGGRGLALFCLGLVSANHWFAAIGLCGHVHARHTGRSPLWFVAGVLVVGWLLSAAFLVGIRWSLEAAVLAFCLRGSLGIWHFLQDRWIWKLSDPQVRATIGKDLFARA